MRHATTGSTFKTGQRMARAFIGSLAGLAVLLSLAQPQSAHAQLRMTQAEGLRLAFPEPLQLERKTAFLDEAQVAAAQELAGKDVEVDRSVVTYYVASGKQVPAGVAYFDAHRVRTLPEVLMIVVTPEGKIRRIEVLKFSEPPEYLAPESWLQQFEGSGLTSELALKRSIVNVTGATLTSQAVTRASRRVLALHQVIDPFNTKEDSPVR